MMTIKLTSPRDLQAGDRIERFYGHGDSKRVECTVVEVRKVQWAGATAYYIRIQRPEGVSANEMRDHFHVRPQARIRVSS